MRSPLSKEELLLALPTLVVLLAVQIRLLPYCADDALIHFRIAENFIATGAPYYNPGEAVMATSSTLWTLIVSAIFLITGYAASAIALLNAALTVGTGLAFARLAKVFYGRDARTISAAAFFLSVAVVISSSIQLMETPLALFLLGCGLVAYFKGKAISFVWLTLACFTRLEMLAFLAVVFGENMLYARVPFKRAALAITATALPFLIFDYYFFATVIPQTVVAKSVIYDLNSSEFLTFAVAGLLGKYVFYGFPLVVLIFFTLLTTVGIYFCLLHLHPPEYVARDQRVLIVLAGGLLIFLVYAVKRVYIFPWYVPLYSLPIFFAFLFSAYTKKSVPVRLLAALLIAPTAFSFCLDVSAGLGLSNINLYSEYEGGVRATAYRQAGQEINRTCPRCSLMAAEIGGLGSAFSGTILDAAGLATPRALAFQRKHGATHRTNLGGIIPVHYVREAKPDVIVGMQSFLTEIAESDVAREYRWENFAVNPDSLQKVLGEPLQILTRRK